MERFVHEQNIIHFHKMLETATDPAERLRILALLAEEEARFDRARQPKER